MIQLMHFADSTTFRKKMARPLVKSAVLPDAVSGSFPLFQGSGKARKPANMTCSRRSSQLRFLGFTGLKASNDLHLVSGFSKDFRLAVSASVSAPKGKASRGVAVAMFERFTEKAIKVIMLAQEEARRLGHNFVGTEQILLGLIGEGTGIAAKVLKSMGINLKDARIEVEKIIGRGSGFVAVEIPFTPRAKRVLELSLEEARQLGHNYIGSEHLLLGLLREGEGVAARVLENLGADTSNIRTQVIRMVGESTEAVGAGVGGGSSGNKMPTLDEFGTNLTKLAEECIGATTLDEYRKHIEKDPALERRFQPVKVPEPNVDETIEILKGLRERYEIHHKLRYTDEALIAAAHLSYQYIRFLEQSHSASFIFSLHFLHLLKPEPCITFFTLVFLCGFSDRFLPDKAIDLVDEAGSRVRLRHAQVFYFLIVAGELRDREMELKAQISALVDKGKERSQAENEAGEGGPVVTEVDIQHIVSAWTGIPVEKVSSDESDRLLKMEETLHKRVVGQDEAVKAISRAIRRARVGLKNPNRPIASFIFSGPTGVGKSELAKALAAYYFGSEEAMIRLDMSEFMERHTVSKLIGSPPGYVGYTEGGQLTEAVRRRPYTVVLFDEIEKAHPDVFNMMLQILEDGRLTDSKGRTVDFKNTLLIMTSNVGSSVIEKGGRRIGFDLDYDEKDSSYNRIKSLVTEELKQYFRPEFLNRLDEMIVFRQLTKLEVREIADIMLKEVFERLKAKDIELQVTERFRDRVVEEGYSPSYGARPLRRAIMRLLEDSMAEKMLAGEINEGDSAIVDVDADGNVTVLNGRTGLPEQLPPAIPV
ncbi:hypothetical protein GW17_00014418 [Ensete ventricosum]|nr:hypothetical protein GW17_00014418 [Ensete ventricosum]